MNAVGARSNTPATVVLVAAIVTAVAWFLPWETFLGQGWSLFNLMQLTGKTTLGHFMIVGGPIIAGIGAGYRVVSAAAGRGSAIAAGIGSGLCVAACALTIAVFPSTADAQFGGQVGVGVYMALIASGVGLAASVADYRSIPRGVTQPWAPSMAPSPGGQWPAPMVAPPAPLAYQPPPPTGWQGPVPAPGVAPAGSLGAAGAVGRISYVEGGRPSTFAVNAGEQIIVGRDAGARVRLTDPRVSRQHVMITWSGTGWSVRDLGATNPTRLLGASGVAQPVVGEIRISSGQLLVGEVLVTLFPVGP